MPIFEHIYIKRIENDEHGQEQYRTARLSLVGTVFYEETERRRRYNSLSDAILALERNGWKWKKSVKLEG